MSGDDESPEGWLDARYDDDALVGLEQELARELESARSLWEASIELVPLEDDLGGGVTVGLTAEAPPPRRLAARR